MAGARARKLDLSGFLSGNANAANIIAGAPQKSLLSGILDGVAGGVDLAVGRKREDKRLDEARADRLAERDYQHSRDKFREDLALRADARAEADQRIQEEDHKRKIASDAAAVEETANLIARAKAAALTNMVLDPVVLEKIQKLSSVIGLAGGPLAIMAKAAAQREENPAGLIQRTAELKTLSSLLTRELGREKDDVRHAAIGDGLMKLSSVIAANEYRLKVHEANANRAATAEAKRADAEKKVADETTQFQSLAPTRFPDLTQEELRGAAGALAKGMTAESAFAQIGSARSAAAQAKKDAESKARQDERLAMSRERQEIARKGFALREEAAARAVEKRDVAAYEREVDVAKDKVARAKYEIGLLKDREGATKEEKEAADAAYYAAAGSLERIEQLRPTMAGTPAPTRTPAPAPAVPTVPEGPVWTDDEAKEAARAEVAKSPGKRDEIIAKWKALVGKPKSNAR